MKKIIVLLVFSISTAYAQSFEWARRAGLWAFDLGYATATDNAGNVYISGKYEMNASFGNVTVGCAGNHDIYLAKYGPDGSFKWVRTAGGTSGDYTHAMCADGDGNTYITGEIELTVNFGSGVSLTSNGGNDIFVAKYNTNGDLQWARKLGGSSKSDKGLGITLSNTNLYVTGNFQGNANFAGTAMASSGGLDVFIAKYTTAGVLQWIKKAGGPGDDEGYATCSDASGNFYVTGYFSGTANFGGSTLTSSGATDIFIAKYNASGNLTWAKKAGGTSSDYGMGIAIDNSGRLFLTGGFRLNSYFGSIPITAQGGNADIFVACYTNAGNPVWVKKAGGHINDYGRAIAVDASSNTYITGNYGLSATFGTTTINGSDSTEIYFASYDVSGNLRWVLKADGISDASDPGRYIEMGLSIAVDHSGNVFASGTYRSNSAFGSTLLKTWDHTDVFLVKIKQSGRAPVQGETAKEIASDASPASLIPIVQAAGSTTFCAGGSVLLSADPGTNLSYQWIKNGKEIPGENAGTLKVTGEGEYQVKCTSAQGEGWSAPEKVTVNNALSARITAGGRTSFCPGDSVVLYANTCEGYIYQWKKNDEDIEGATHSTFVAKTPGDYQVKIISTQSVAWSALVSISADPCREPEEINQDAPVETLKLNSLQDAFKIIVYPNPGTGIFSVNIDMEQVKELKTELKVINSVGQVVYSKSPEQNGNSIRETIELESSLPAGIYFLQVTSGGRTETVRLMLNH